MPRGGWEPIVGGEAGCGCGPALALLWPAKLWPKPAPLEDSTERLSGSRRSVRGMAACCVKFLSTDGRRTAQMSNVVVPVCRRVCAF